MMMTNNFIQKKLVNSKKPYIIAEIGINHNGKISLAKKMISAAKKSGASCVKFQKFYADDYISKYAGKAKYQADYKSLKKSSQLSIIKSCQLNIDQIKELKKFSKKKNIDFLCTPFETRSLKELVKIGIEAIKISSDNLNNIPFLIEAGKTKLPILLSTGMGNYQEVKNAVKIFQKYKNPLLIFQCTSNYPSNLKNSNLAVLTKFKKKFNCSIGLSDHTQSVTPALVAISLGAIAIEKHFTLSRKLKGIDQKASIEPKELNHLVKKCIEAKLALGKDNKAPSEEEKNSIKNIRRSIVAMFNLQKGTKIKKEMITIKRPGLGISPNNFKKIIGKKLKKNKKRDEIIFWKDFK